MPCSFRGPDRHIMSQDAETDLACYTVLGSSRRNSNKQHLGNEPNRSKLYRG
jgi:hypothetical protein